MKIKMFNQGVLGDSNPLQLLCIVIYMLGLHCALRGGVEHNNLRRLGCDSQIKIERDDMGRECIVYREDPLLKTNQGGLLCRNRSKIVYNMGLNIKIGVQFSLQEVCKTITRGYYLQKVVFKSEKKSHAECLVL